MFNFESVNSRLVIIVIITFATSILLTGVFVLAARRWNWRTAANERSLHDGYILVGGGSVIMVVTLLTWCSIIETFDPLIITLLISILLLAVISWIDDIGTVPIAIRFLIQIFVVAACLYAMPFNDRVFSSHWPLVIDRLFTAFCWIWFINLFNFMDGMDGLAASESVAICLGILLIGSIVGIPVIWLLAAASLLGSSLGFLPWNWYPSKVILGDVGAVPMGFLTGFLLIQLAVYQQLQAAFIIPLYFLLDATITIFKRLFQSKRIWLAHREHFYQKAFLAGASSSHVVLSAIVTNVILIGLAFLSIDLPIVGTVLAMIIGSFLLFYFNRLART